MYWFLARATNAISGPLVVLNLFQAATTDGPAWLRLLSLLAAALNANSLWVTDRLLAEAPVWGRP